MKTLLLALLALSNSPTTRAHDIPDLPPDAVGSDYRSNLAPSPAGDDGLEPALAAGERNLDWLNHINSFRQEGQKLSFTSKETQRGYPIEEPNEYSPPIITKKFGELRAAIPAPMAEVLFRGGSFSDVPPLPEQEYIRWGHEMDRVYQIAARWRMMKAWLPSLASRRKGDIRGYYFLSRLEGREAKLKDYRGLEAEERARIREWLIGMCFNGDRALAACTADLDQLIAKNGDLNTYYSSAESSSADRYHAYFAIPSFAARRDFRWENLPDGGSRLLTPFLDPGKENVRHFVQFNVMDEWKWQDWRLDLGFVDGGSHPYIVFVPGATPNVNGLGGDRITMNANQPLTEYDAQWTIRHEFGHVLGLPDCYVEFYMAERQTIVNYQIDINNIMCSRRGHIKRENVEELKRAYSR